MADEVSPPATIEPDWNYIQERYLQGDELAIIAEDTGATVNAIRCRAHRNRWKQQQLKLLERNKLEIEHEIKGNLIVSVLRESRAYQREDIPADPESRDVLSRCRERLINAATRLFGWDADPLAKTKQVKAIDV